MARHHPHIELAGYQRLHDLERRIFYSPVAWTLFLIGMGGAAYGLWNLRGGLVLFPRGLVVGYGIFLATYLGLLAYYYAYRFRRLKCPNCDQLMQPYVADLEDGTWRRFIQAFEISGRFYRRPYDEDDRRPWVRLMKLVRVCPRCRTFVDCARLHQQTCTQDELAELQQRLPAT